MIDQRNNDSELLERVLRHIIKMFVKGSLMFRHRKEVTHEDLRPAAERLRSARELSRIPV